MVDRIHDNMKFQKQNYIAFLKPNKDPSFLKKPIHLGKTRIDCKNQSIFNVKPITMHLLLQSEP
uniref:Uncharacterized protein n=1 Tax=Arundo donax TaxID=35708 RepID=A0A0A9DXU6_ARUDO